MSTFDSTKNRLADLLRDIEAGKIQLPDFQRGWVWDDEHIRSLLTSIARAFPVGAIMLLESGDRVPLPPPGWATKGDYRNMVLISLATMTKVRRRVPYWSGLSAAT